MATMTKEKYAALAKVRQDNIAGMLMAEEVVDAARSPKSALHDHFEWDNDICGDAYRLEQARQLIRVFVRPYDLDGQIREVRVYASFATEPGHEDGYVPMVTVLSDADRKRDLLIKVLRQALSAFRYHPLPELDGIVNEIKDLLMQYGVSDFMPPDGKGKDGKRRRRKDEART